MIQMHLDDVSDEAIETKAEIEVDVRDKVYNGLKVWLHLVRELGLDK